MLKKFFIKRAIKNSVADAGKAIRREVRMVKKITGDLGRNLTSTRGPLKIKVK